MLARSGFLAALGAAGAMLATAPSRAAALTPLDVGAVLEDDSSAVLYGVAAGDFTRQGLDLHIQRIASGSLAVSAAVSGTLQIAKASVIALVTAFARGVPLTIIAPSAVSTPENPIAGLIVRADSPLRSGKDFNGKTFGVIALVDARVLSIRAWVDANGGDSHSLHFIEIPGSETVAALMANRIDATVASNPVLSEVLASGNVRQIAQPNLAVAPRFVINAWFTTLAYAQANPDVVRRFRAGLRTAVTYADAHPREMATYLAPFSGIDLATLRATTRSTIALDLDPREFQPVIDAAAKYGFIDKPFPAATMLLLV